MPLTDYVALVSLTRDIPTAADLLQVAAAIQKQMTRDFAPHWGSPRTVDAFEDLDVGAERLPPVVMFSASDELVRQPRVRDRERARGRDRRRVRARAAVRHAHELVHPPAVRAGRAQPTPGALTLSHEVLEMIADPFGNRLIAAAHPIDPERRVRYLLEVCDPCQAVWYPVNGVPVSDFYCPRYFDPVLHRPATGTASPARSSVRCRSSKGGYLSWIDPGDSALYQLGAGETAGDLRGGSRRSQAQHRRAADDRRHESARPPN